VIWGKKVPQHSVENLLAGRPPGQSQQHSNPGFPVSLIQSTNGECVEKSVSWRAPKDQYLALDLFAGKSMMTRTGTFSAVNRELVFCAWAIMILLGRIKFLEDLGVSGWQSRFYFSLIRFCEDRRVRATTSALEEST
jgi:hypothetical protein